MVGSSSMAGALLVAVFFSKVEFWGGGGWQWFVQSFKKYEKVFYNIFILVHIGSQTR